MFTADDRLLAVRAGRFAVTAHQERRGFAQPDLQDCLVDLFHWAEASGIDVEALAHCALKNWKTERHDRR